MNTPLRTIKLSGVLSRKFGHVFRLAVSSPAEAVRALCVIVPGFERFLMESKDLGYEFAVMVGRRNLAAEELRTPVGNDEIRFVPILKGSKKGGIVQIIAGAVLIIAGIFVTGLSYGWAAPVGNYMIGMGISMIVGGVIQMLSPQPKMNKQEERDNKTSYLFQGAVNVQAQGNPVPILYGELWVGSNVISAGMDVSDGYVPREDYLLGAGRGRGYTLIGNVGDQTSPGNTQIA